jgi:hypothetical protein
LFGENLYGFQVLFESQYIPIDSINQTHCGRLINLNLVNKEIDLIINNQNITFFQKDNIDTTQNGIFSHQILRNKNDTMYALRLSKLLSFDSNSIFVSAEYAFAEYLEKYYYRSGLLSDYASIDSIPISRANLLGINVSPTKKEMKKAYNKMTWIIIGAGVVISYFAWKSEKKK